MDKLVVNFPNGRLVAQVKNEDDDIDRTLGERLAFIPNGSSRRITSPAFIHRKLTSIGIIGTTPKVGISNLRSTILGLLKLQKSKTIESCQLSVRQAMSLVGENGLRIYLKRPLERTWKQFRNGQLPSICNAPKYDQSFDQESINENGLVVTVGKSYCFNGKTIKVESLGVDYLNPSRSQQDFFIDASDSTGKFWKDIKIDDLSSTFKCSNGEKTKE